VAAEERTAIAENLENFFLFGLHAGSLKRESPSVKSETSLRTEIISLRLWLVVPAF
jgi:hypothetical protein